HTIALLPIPTRRSSDLLNYRTEPFQKRLAKDKDPSRIFRSDIHGSPSTPIMEAFQGEAVKIHVLVPFSEQSHVFSLEGHTWPSRSEEHTSELQSPDHLV